MTGLLDLSRELRDMIWTLCVVSPTGFIAPLQRDIDHAIQQVNASPDKPQYYLVVANPDPNIEIKACTPENEVVTLSLGRTCRQIHRETKGLFWAENTFLFKSPQHLTCVFKNMGPSGFRNILSIQLFLGPPRDDLLETLKHAFVLLLKAQPGSALQRLALAITAIEISDLEEIKKEVGFYRHQPGLNIGRRGRPWYKELKRLMKTGSGINVQRKIVVALEGPLVLPEAKRAVIPTMEPFRRCLNSWERTMGDLHRAWGAPMTFHDELIFEGGQQVGDSLLERLNRSRIIIE